MTASFLPIKPTGGIGKTDGDYEAVYFEVVGTQQRYLRIMRQYVSCC
jgi:hypothetical protein